ncbi:MAG: regulatory protein GemA [Bacteroidota bacterium]
MLIGTKQKALIHVAKTKLGLDDDRYRDLLRSTCGVESAKELDFIQYDKLMKRFRELGFKISHKKGHRQPYLQAPDRDPGGLPSPAHLRKVNELYEQLGWGQERRIGLNKRIIKKPWPQTRAETNKIIEALKSMVARKQKTV